MTQAEICSALATAAWFDFTPEGGENYYDQWNDPCEIAATMGAAGRDLPNESPANNSNVREYLFADGSIAWVILNDHNIGCGITLNNRAGGSIEATAENLGL